MATSFCWILSIKVTPFNCFPHPFCASPFCVISEFCNPIQKQITLLSEEIIGPLDNKNPIINMLCQNKLCRAKTSSVTSIFFFFFAFLKCSKHNYQSDQVLENFKYSFHFDGITLIEVPGNEVGCVVPYTRVCVQQTRLQGWSYYVKSRLCKTPTRLEPIQEDCNRGQLFRPYWDSSAQHYRLQHYRLRSLAVLISLLCVQRLTKTAWSEEFKKFSTIRCNIRCCYTRQFFLQLATQQMRRALRGKLQHACCTLQLIS